MMLKLNIKEEIPIENNEGPCLIPRFVFNSLGDDFRVSRIVFDAMLKAIQFVESRKYKSRTTKQIALHRRFMTILENKRVRIYRT